MAKIPNDLLEAYKGFYEESYDVPDPIAKLISDSPLERLDVYCIWNGIFGYSRRLYEIATSTEKYEHEN